MDKGVIMKRSTTLVSVLSGLLFSSYSFAAQTSIADLIAQSPAKQLTSLCGSDAMSELCSSQAEAFRNQIVNQNQLNVETMQNQATTVFDNTLKPLIDALQSGAQ